LLGETEAVPKIWQENKKIARFHLKFLAGKNPAKPGPNILL
jgi:hypothetical protein